MALPFFVRRAETDPRPPPEDAPEFRSQEDPMNRLVLLGDSTLDNAAYAGGGPAVIDQVRSRLPEGWRATLLAWTAAPSRTSTARSAASPVTPATWP